MKIAALSTVIIGLSTAVALAQQMPTVRVVRENAVVSSSRVARSDVLATPDVGTTLDVLDVEGGWVWVLLPADLDGTRRPGWIRARAVETVTTGAAGYSMWGVAAALEEERAAAEARLSEARRALERAREEYEKAKAMPLPEPDTP